MTQIIIIDTPPTTAIAINSYHTLDELVREGLGKFPTFTERRLEPGEAKTKIALLNFSSGTTGRPKAVAIPHYALIANVVQMAFFCKAAVDYTSKEQQRYRPGLVAIAGICLFYPLHILNRSDSFPSPVLPFYRMFLITISITQLQEFAFRYLRVGRRHALPHLLRSMFAVFYSLV